MSDTRTFRLVHTQARQRAAQAIAEAPDAYVCTIAEPRRNNEQNALLHALLTEIADRVEWAGSKHDVDTWKRLLVGAWDRATGEPVVMLPALDGRGVEVVFRRTSSLSKRECSELIDFINCWAAERPEFQEQEA